MLKLVRQFLLLTAVALWAHQLAVPGAASTCESAARLLLTADEALVVRLINAERLEWGLEPLLGDGVLIRVAREHSRDMAERGYFAHLAPNRVARTPLDRYAAALGRRPDTVVAENIGRAGEPVMGMIHAFMMGSPAHKANILDPEYVRLGVGIHMLPDGRVWVTEMFRGPLPQTR